MFFLARGSFISDPHAFIFFLLFYVDLNFQALWDRSSEINILVVFLIFEEIYSFIFSSNHTV